MSTNSLALSRLLIAERKSLLRRVQRLVGHDGAEDVAQKVWLKVQAVRDIPPIEDKKAYLWRLAHNLAVDQISETTRQDRLIERSRALLWGSEYEIDPERILASQGMLRRIGDAISAMPELTRTILRLTRIDGLTQRETAEKIGVSTTTVENHLRKALSVMARIRDAEERSA